MVLGRIVGATFGLRDGLDGRVGPYIRKGSDMAISAKSTW